MLPCGLVRLIDERNSEVATLGQGIKQSIRTTVTVVRRDQLIGEPRGAGTRVDAHGGADAVARSVGALQGIEVGGPSFVSV